ncbi:MAG: type IV secretory system conjugative DNA transfer family protein [Bacteroidota bacterium]
MEAIIGLIILILAFGLIIKATINSGNPVGAIFAILGALFGAVGSGLYHLFMINHARRRGVHGTARFMNWVEKPQLLSRANKGLVIDGHRRLSEKRSFQHMVCIAPTGLGKTTKIIIPNLLQMKNASAVVTDPSGEIYQRTAGYLQSRGFVTKEVRFEDLSRSLCYNPLFRAKSYAEMKQVATVLVNTAFPDAKGDAAFWNSSAVNILNIFIRLLAQEDARFQNLHNLRYLLNSFGRDGAALNDFVARNADPSTFAEYQGFLVQDDKVIQGALSTARNALDKVSDPRIAKLTSMESLHFEEIRQQPTVIYLIMPEHKVSYYSFLLQLFFSQLMESLMQHPVPSQPFLPVYLLLDEFGNMGKFPDFSAVLTTLRKYQVSCTMILQSTRQLINTYGEADAGTILEGGAASKVFFPALGIKTTEELERVLGKQTLWYVEPGMNRSEREIARSLLTSDEIRRMRDDQALFLHTNKRPVRLSMTPYYKDGQMRSRSEMTPLQPPITNPGHLDLLSLS